MGDRNATYRNVVRNRIAIAKKITNACKKYRENLSHLESCIGNEVRRILGGSPHNQNKNDGIRRLVFAILSGPQVGRA